MGVRCTKFSDDLVRRAKDALRKRARYGPDLDLSSFKLEGGEGEAFPSLSIENPAAKYYQVDLKSYYEKISPGIEVMDVEEAYSEYKDLFWRLIPPDLDKYTAIALLKGKGGMFLRVKKGRKIERPISACFSISNSGLQAPHSIIYVERGASVTLISGCTAMRERPSLHVGVTEIYLEEGASVSYVSVHTWKPKVHVRPRNGVKLGPRAKYCEFYFNMSEAETLQSETRIEASDLSKVEVNSVLTCKGRYYMDYFSEILLQGKESSGEIVSKALCSKGGEVITRSRVVGRGKGSSGHVECDGMLLDKSSKIGTVPELEAVGDEVSLTHEASIGKISDDEIFYLMTKGFKEEEAKRLIVRGFLEIDLSPLPSQLRSYLTSILSKMSEGM